MSAAEEKRRNELLGDINRVGVWVTTAADNGLFNKSNESGVSSEEIQGILGKARKNLDKTDPPSFSLSSCETNIALAADSYAKALNSASRWWRFNNVYGGPIWIYLITFLISTILAVYYFRIDQLIVNNFSHNGLHSTNGIFAATWGVIGGILRGLWYLKERVNDRQYRNSWTLFYLSGPFIGGILGAAVYFFWVAGLFSIAKSDIDIKSHALLVAMALTFGFSWPNSINLLQKLADVISPEKQSGSTGKK